MLMETAPPFPSVCHGHQPRLSVNLKDLAPTQYIGKVRMAFRQQQREASTETPPYKRRASSLSRDRLPHGTSTAIQTPRTITFNTYPFIIDPSTGESIVRGIESRQSERTTSTTGTTFHSYCKVPKQIIKTAIDAAARVETSQSPFTQREAEEIIRIHHLHRWNPNTYFDVIGGSVGKVAECMARNSTICHPRACVIAFLKVIDEIWHGDVLKICYA